MSLNNHFIRVGDKAPDFCAKAVYQQEFKQVKLSDYIDFTFVCPTEITAFSDSYDLINALNTEVLGISVDSEYCHLAWLQTDREIGGVGDLNYPLVSDLNKLISTSYNVLTDDGKALRGLFIIDKEGIIQHILVNNLDFGRSVTETLRVLKAIQYVQSHPDEVCPANWQPGSPTILSNPKDSKEYFRAI